MNLHETQRLLHGALAGSTEDRDRLFERFSRRTVLWCASRMSEALRAKSEPEDLAQEIVIAAFRDFSQFHGASVPEFGAWYWMIAANRLRDLVDYHGAKKRQPAEIPALTQTSPSQAAVTSDLAARVRRAIETLGEEQRMAVCLVFLEERSPEEAARILDKTVNAVRILYFRAMRELRARLGQTG